jgi:hypothetical protein
VKKKSVGIMAVKAEAAIALRLRLYQNYAAPYGSGSTTQRENWHQNRTVPVLFNIFHSYNGT